MNLTESLKELNLKNQSGVPSTPCGAPNLKGKSLKNLMSDMMKSDWTEALGDLMGYDNLCNMDTTSQQPNDDEADGGMVRSGMNLNSKNSADEESYHDFYLI